MSDPPFDPTKAPTFRLKRQQKELGKSGIQAKVVAYAVKKKNCMAVPLKTPGSRHHPDYLFLREGVTLVMEFKAPGKRPTPAQRIQMERWHEAGAHVFEVDNVDLGRRIIDLLDDIPGFVDALNEAALRFALVSSTRH